MIRLAINGYGRIGRNVLRSLYESSFRQHMQIVAINDVADLEVSAHLTRYDSTHGRFTHEVEIDQEHEDLVIDGDHIHRYTTRNVAEIDWGKHDVDVVLECTGKYASKEKAAIHLQQGAKKVLISAPAGNDLPTIVYGVNHQVLTATDDIVSNASCTTNCLAPVAKVLNDAIGIDNGLVNTVHAYTNDQNLLDVPHKDMRRARSATQSMIPSTTGAAKAVGLVLPELAGKLDGLAIRVPTINVSVVDLTFTAQRNTTVDEINGLMKQASAQSKGVLGYNERPLVSMDFNHTIEASIFDATQTKVLGNTVKVFSWYDNEWGFSNQMLRTAQVMMTC